MESNASHKKILEKILKSECFQEKDLYQKLLKYLVEASFEKEAPKEINIAFEVFKKDKDFNTAEDTTVRVHMHKLRKRLDQYYQTEGKQDKTKLYIPKGHYKVKFKEELYSDKQSDKPKINLKEIILLVSLILVVFYVIIDKTVLQTDSFAGRLTKNAVWDNFFKNGYSTSVIIGDFQIFHEYDSHLGRIRRIQDYEINNVDELDNYIKVNPDRDPENWPLGELPHNCLFNILDLQKVFLSYKQKVNIDFTTEIDINYIKNRNIIYLGEFKNLRALSNLTSTLPIRQETLPWWHGTLSYYENDSLITLQTAHDWNVNRYVIDLAVVAKLPGENNENYLIFAGIGYNAQIKIVEMFSNNDELKDLEKQIKKINNHIPEYYALVFEVKGFDRASTKAELKFFHEIKKN